MMTMLNSAGSERTFARNLLGFAGGDVNLYRWVGNDPVNSLDPSGLMKFHFSADDSELIMEVTVLIQFFDSIQNEQWGTPAGSKYWTTFRRQDFIFRAETLIPLVFNQSGHVIEPSIKTRPVIITEQFGRDLMRNEERLLPTRFANGLRPMLKVKIVEATNDYDFMFRVISGDPTEKYPNHVQSRPELHEIVPKARAVLV